MYIPNLSGPVKPTWAAQPLRLDVSAWCADFALIGVESGLHECVSRLARPVFGDILILERTLGITLVGVLDGLQLDEEAGVPMHRHEDFLQGELYLPPALHIALSTAASSA